MKEPNLIIIGAQKCGTSWLHRALNCSKYFVGSRPKELNYWNRPKGMDYETYQGYFRTGRRAVRYWFESTPVYFQKPARKVDVAKRIRDGLGDIPLIVMLRDPTERYLSAYTHHMMKGRFPRVSEISEVSDTFKMMSLGNYGSILEHYRNYFSNIQVHLFDDLKADGFSLVKTVMDQLCIPCDLQPRDIDFRANAKDLKVSKAGWNDGIMPILSPDARCQLNDYYRDEIALLSRQINRDISHWLR